MSFLSYLLREAGFLPSGTLLKLTESMGDPRTEEAATRWMLTMHRAKQRQRTVWMDIAWRRR